MRLPRIHAAGARATALAFACAIAATLACAPAARAQSTEIPGPPQRTAIVLRHGVAFWVTLLACCVLTFVLYLITVWLLGKFGIAL